MNYLRKTSSYPIAIACALSLSTSFTKVSAESGKQVESEDKLSPSNDKTSGGLFAWPRGERMAISLFYDDAIDGKTERTYTPPCGDTIVSGEYYIPEIRSLFVSVKGFELVEPGFATIWGPSDSSGQTLIDRVKAESAKGTKLFNILFHGIGGDYLTVSCKAHEELLEFLAENRKIFWVDSYLNISKYMIEYRAQE